MRRTDVRLGPEGHALALTRALDTLRIGPQNEIELIGGGEDQLPSGVHRAPDDPNADGAFWVERDWPNE